jgi:hypothetical protein
MATPDYGPLKEVVAGAGAIIAASTAILATWSGRAGFGLSADELPRGAQRVGGLLAGLAIVLIWVSWRDGAHNHQLVVAIIALGSVTLASLILYASLIGTLTYEKVELDGSTRRIIGGFWLTPQARAKRKAGTGVQQLLEGAAYDTEKLWSRSSRQLATLTFLIAYLALTICGTVALAAGAIRLGLATGKK